jgi:hypothetical protein
MKTITIVIDKVGQVAMQTNGFEGASCRDATKAIERGLGVVLADRPSFDQGSSQSMVETQQ